MTFKGRDPVRTKIVIDNKIMEQVNSCNYSGNVMSCGKELDINSCNYSGNVMSCGKELDIDSKLHNYLKITGILNYVFRPQKTLNKTIIKLYNTPALQFCYMAAKLGLLKQRTPDE
jgi:hypothetical protein